MAKKKRARTVRREGERAAVKDAEARLKLARLEAGGAPERPIELTSASVVEPHAASLACVVCDARTRVEEHVVEQGLRVARVRCTRCGVRRNVYFRLIAPN